MKSGIRQRQPAELFTSHRKTVLIVEMCPKVQIDITIVLSRGSDFELISKLKDMERRMETLTKDIYFNKTNKTEGFFWVRKKASNLLKKRLHLCHYTEGQLICIVSLHRRLPHPCNVTTQKDTWSSSEVSLYKRIGHYIEGQLICKKTKTYLRKKFLLI